jgi:hypothetical protein
MYKQRSDAEVHLNNKSPDRTAKKTPHFSVTKINWLTLFKEIISVYSENRSKPLHTFCGQNAKLLRVKESGTYSYHSALKG